MSGYSALIAARAESLSEMSLYQRFLAEREQVLKHKWLESERRGEDIGWEAALLDWVKNHRSTWIRDRSTEV